MKYDEDATQAAHYLREAIPLMVKYGIHPNPRNFALWYTYVSQRTPDLNQELDQTIDQYNTCPAEISADLFRRYVIDDEVDFAQQVQQNLAKIINHLSTQTEHTLRDKQVFENHLHQGLEELQSSTIDGSIEKVIFNLIEHTKDATKVAEQFRGEIDKANSEIEELRRELNELAEQASLDALTELSNRRSFDKEIKRLASEAQTNSAPLSLLLTDIDHFKKCNDTYGHVIGDKVLQSFAQMLTHVCAEKGFPARFGGEEFVVLLPNHSLNQALEVAEEIRRVTQNMKIKQRGLDQEIERITTSVGVAQYQPSEDLQDYIGRADNALYQAKEGGRNRVVAAD
ncbi:MAG: GGDEF domain-containing protein [Pseudomonadales bacterium]|nr:GGDEF domain-containing protein [Pseudomonadales bacterium]